MRVIPGNSQHIGMRDQQEDSFGFSNMENAQFVSTSGIMAVLADGMGGLAMGAEASQLAVTSVLDAYEARSQQEPIDESLFKVVHQANNAVKEYAYSIGQEHEMGTTLVAAVVQQDHLYWASVGDSRIYLYRDGNMIQLNKDHVYGQELQEQVARGLMSREEAENHPERDALTSYIGIPVLEKIDISHRPVQIKPGDKIMLCSDGLYRTLSKQEMLAYLERDAQEACDSMIDAVLARRRPYQDNTTILVLEVEAGSQRSIPATTSLAGGLTRRQQGDINYARTGKMLAGEEQVIARPGMIPENLNYKRLGILAGSVVLLLAVLTVGIIFIKDRLGSDTASTSSSTVNDEDLAGTARVPGLTEFDFRRAATGTTTTNTNNSSNTNSSSSNSSTSENGQDEQSGSDNSDSNSNDNDSTGDNTDNDTGTDTGNSNNNNSTDTGNANDNNTDNNTGTNDNSTGNNTGTQNPVPGPIQDTLNQVPGNIPSNPADLF